MSAAADRIAFLDSLPAEELCAQAESALQALVTMMNEETTLLRAGRFRDAAGLTAQKTQLAQDYVVFARSVQRAYSDAWMSAARRRRAGAGSVRFPRRPRGVVPVRFYAGTFTLAVDDAGRARVRLPVARGAAPLWVRLARPSPYPATTGG